MFRRNTLNPSRTQSPAWASMFQWPLLLLSLSNLASAKPNADSSLNQCHGVTYDVVLLLDKSESGYYTQCDTSFDKLPQALNTICSHGGSPPRLDVRNTGSQDGHPIICECMVQAILDQKYTADVSSTSCNIVDVKTRWEENWKTQHHGKLSLEVRGNPGNKTNCADDDDKDVDS